MPIESQDDWLQFTTGDHPLKPTVGELSPSGIAIDRYDFVYLCGRQQEVTGVEDNEILDPALGGVDTTTRLRNSGRVAVKASVDAKNCEDAFAKLVEELEADGTKTFSASDCSLRSKARLSVNFLGGQNDDLCAPQFDGGFLGAENQAIRVRMTAADKLIWSYDNASPFYR